MERRSSAFCALMIRSRPPAPASTSPLLNPPSAIASRTVSAMGVISMPYWNARVKDQRNQGVLVALHNGRSPVGLLAFQSESTGVDGAYSPPELDGSAREAAQAASRVVPPGAISVPAKASSRRQPA